MADKDGFWGWNNSTDATHEYNERAFMISQALRTVNTATICKVQKCTVDSVVGPIGQVNILPLVDLIDGKGQTSKHQSVLSLPYLRMHAGARAIIMDPKEGDIGLVVFADRDIQSVKKAKKQAPPGSRRHHNMADGMYVGTLIADAPTSYVRFDGDGNIHISPDNGTTLWRIKAGEIYGTPDSGATWVKIVPGKVTLTADSGATPVVVTPGRVDLGADPAPLGVMLAGGVVSTVVFGKP